MTGTGQTILAIVPARSGSKGFPGKNMATLGPDKDGKSKPLVRWPYDTLQDLIDRDRKVGDHIVRWLSTDSQKIVEAWPQIPLGEIKLRPKNLARDDSAAIDVIKYELERYELERYEDESCGEADVGAVLWFQPTSPLVNSEDILAMIRALDQDTYPARSDRTGPGDSGLGAIHYGSARSVIAVTPAVHPLQWGMYRHEDGTVENPLHELGTGRRQEQPVAYYPIGVFLATVPYIQEHGTAVVPGLTRSVVVPRERAVDIDTEDDLVVAEAYLKKQMR